MEHLEAIQKQNEMLVEYLKGQGQYQDTLTRLVDNLGGYGGMKQVAHTGTLLHGPGGLFNTPGLDEAVISLHVRSRGLGQLLPAFPSTSKSPFFGFITGFDAETGSEPVNPCDAAPKGTMTSGTLSAKFGHVARDTNDIRVPDTLWKNNTGETMDLTLLGAITRPESSGVYMPSDLPADESILELVTNAEKVIAGINMERKLSTLLWTGDGTGANDTANGGYIEFPGLDNQIATGQVDAEITGKPIPGADSAMIDFVYNDISSTDIVEPLEEMEDYLYNLAADTGVDPVRWVLVARPMAWRKLTSVWPVQYNTQPDYDIIAGTEGRLILDARANVDERDRLRNNMVLPLNGRLIDVVTDHGIVEQDANSGVGLVAGEYASSLYFVPLAINGSFPVTYWEYLNHQLSVSQSGLPANMINWYSDAGRFLWSMKDQYTCFNLKMETDPRVVLRTPHLAGRVQDIKYTRTNLPLRDPDPNSPRWVGGGVDVGDRPGPTTYAVWK